LLELCCLSKLCLLVIRVIHLAQVVLELCLVGKFKLTSRVTIVGCRTFVLGLPNRVGVVVAKTRVAEDTVLLQLLKLLLASVLALILNNSLVLDKLGITDLVL